MSTNEININLYESENGMAFARILNADRTMEVGRRFWGYDKAEALQVATTYAMTQTAFLGLDILVVLDVL